jgi:uncharacterized protein (DUF488 family)
MDLLTIGYEGRSLSNLVQALADNGVDRLVDVRERPFSRRKGFSAMALFEELRKAHIAYEHGAGLGNPEAIRALWKNGHLEEGKERYRDFLRAERLRHVAAVVELASNERVCLLCFEGDSERCHRSIIAEEAAEVEPALQVRHL